MIAKQQIYLLKAALLPESDALIFWQKWKESNRFQDEDLSALRILMFDSVDPESKKILSQVYYNLKAFVRADPYLTAIKSNVRYEWVRNQQLWYSLERLVLELNRAGVKPMLFKGAAAALSFYPDKYLRYLGDMDLFVSAQADDIVRRVLVEYGCTDAYYFSKRYSPLIFHAAQYTSAKNDDFDVHRYLLHEHLYEDANKLLYRGAVETTLVTGGKIYLPSITVQFFLTLVHGTRPGQHPRFLWMADVYRLIHLRGPEIIWDELFSLAQYFKYSSVLADALTQLRTELHLPIPPFDGAASTESKELIGYLRQRGTQPDNRLEQIYKSFLSAVRIYRLFLKGRVNYNLPTWLCRNYLYRLERYFKS